MTISVECYFHHVLEEEAEKDRSTGRRYANDSAIAVFAVFFKFSFHGY